MKLVPLTETFLSLTEKNNRAGQKANSVLPRWKRAGRPEEEEEEEEREGINLFMLPYKIYDVMVFTSRLIVLFAHFYSLGHRE